MRRLLTTLQIVFFLAALVVAVRWYIDPEITYEPLITGLLIVAAIMAAIAKNTFTKKIRNQSDVELFEEFVHLFATGDNIRFFKEHDFLGSFRPTDIQPLYDFVENWDNAAHQFTDRRLECSRKKLYRTAYKLGTAVAVKTVPHNDWSISVKPTSLPAGPTPDWVIKDAQELNRLSKPFVKMHEKFVRIGRRRLY